MTDALLLIVVVSLGATGLTRLLPPVPPPLPPPQATAVRGSRIGLRDVEAMS